jgi:hypothetical protein
MRLLEAAGYACTRAAASLGCWDIVAIGSTDIACIQVKSNCWPSTEEMETLRAFRYPANVRKMVHRWRARRQTPDVREI